MRGVPRRAGMLGSHAVEDLAADRVDAKLAWVAEGAASAGRDPSDVTLSINHCLVRVTPSTVDADLYLERVAASHGVTADLLRQSPAVLVGTVQQLVDTLEARRQRFGFSHLQLDAGFPPKDMQALFPLRVPAGRDVNPGGL